MTKFKQFLVPAVIILMGAGAAFATNVAKDSQASQEGYYFDSTKNECILAEGSSCSPTGSAVCTWKDSNGTVHELSSQINETMCGDPLFRP